MRTRRGSASHVKALAVMPHCPNSTKFDALSWLIRKQLIIFQLEAQLEDPLDRPAKRTKHVSKEGKVVSIARGPFVILCNIRLF